MVLNFAGVNYWKNQRGVDGTRGAVACATLHQLGWPKQNPVLGSCDVWRSLSSCLPMPSEKFCEEPRSPASTLQRKRTKINRAEMTIEKNAAFGYGVKWSLEIMILQRCGRQGRPD